jgi:hypothetical protein
MIMDEATGFDFDDANCIREVVTKLIVDDTCKDRCLQGKAAALEIFVLNRKRFTTEQKITCIKTALSVFHVSEYAHPDRSRCTGKRQRFYYHVPFVGKVCKASFLNCFDVSASTIARYKQSIRDGNIVGASD